MYRSSDFFGLTLFAAVFLYFVGSFLTAVVPYWGPIFLGTTLHTWTASGNAPSLYAEAAWHAAFHIAVITAGGAIVLALICAVLSEPCAALNDCLAEALRRRGFFTTTELRSRQTIDVMRNAMANGMAAVQIARLDKDKVFSGACERLMEQARDAMRHHRDGDYKAAVEVASQAAESARSMRQAVECPDRRPTYRATLALAA